MFWQRTRDCHAARRAGSDCFFHFELEKHILPVGGSLVPELEYLLILFESRVHYILHRHRCAHADALPFSSFVTEQYE